MAQSIIEGNLLDGVGTRTSDSFAIADSLIENHFSKVRTRNNVIRNTDGVGVWATPSHRGTCTIESNFLEKNQVGIRVANPYNSIVGNNVGVERIESVASPLDGTDNWWGDASGASSAEPGGGDTVSNNVFNPWYVLT
ncbi:MAG TPA: hypothetical protein GXX40_01225 [Firmicutes bacterium]|nr:hypothetical protein [Bacillota bacterium]